MTSNLLLTLIKLALLLLLLDASKVSNQNQFVVDSDYDTSIDSYHQYSGDQSYQIARLLFDKKLYNDSSYAYFDALMKGGSYFKVNID